MPAYIFAGILIWAAFSGEVLLWTEPAAVGGFPRGFTLHRAFPNDRRADIDQLKARDRVRHGRFLQSVDGIVGLPLAGSYDPFSVGLYYTKVSLGSPAQDFYVQIDTGSDVLWVTCSQCSGCPSTSGLNIELNSFDYTSSSTASLVYCSDSRCSLGTNSLDSGCNSRNNQCAYQFTYGDGSGTLGYYVSDFFHLETVVGNTWTSNNSATVVFGCSIGATGDLTKTDRAVDGIFGFGQQPLSVVSQLASQRLTPQVFSHCLRGDSAGGGILVFGEIVEPGIVYTPLVQSQPHYNLNLESISVNGQTLSIPSSAFATTSTSGTIVDSGTTLAYLAESAYDPFVNAINNAVQLQSPLVSKGNQCYLITSSVDEIFPNVSLNFAGGASMILKPEDYLLQPKSIRGGEIWCIGFQKTDGQELTILGGTEKGKESHLIELNFRQSSMWNNVIYGFHYHNLCLVEKFSALFHLVLKDKIVVYDLAGQQIGWVNYDCASSVNVSTNSSTGTNTNTVSPEQFTSSSSRNTLNPYIAILSAIVISLLASIRYTP